jgi:phenylacetate-CoA ligase
MQHAGPALGHPAPREAQVTAVHVAQHAAARVPAYGRFLRLAGYDASRLRAFGDFCQLPVMDKASYLTRYPLDARCINADLPGTNLVTMTSGTGGPALFWPRFAEQNDQWLRGMTAMFDEHFHIRERQTLMVAALALGAWGFGASIALVGQRIFSDLGIRGTMVTPGLSQDDTLRYIQQLSPHYDQTVLISYPAMVPALLETGAERGIDWPGLNTGIFTSGEGASEAQRDRMFQLIGKDPDRLEGFLSGFGVTEVGGLLGYETPLCLLLRRLCARDTALTRTLFGEDVMPSLNQYDPRTRFLEVEHGELVLTMAGAVPLVRYNTHDRGGTLALDDVLAACRGHGYDLAAELRARGARSWRPLPFMYAFGRSDAIVVHGGNIYLDEVAQVIEAAELRTSTTGKFELASDADADGRVTVRLAVELRADAEATDELQRLYERTVVDGLQRVSARFRAVYEAQPERVNVAVSLVPFGAGAAWGPKGRRVLLARDGRGGRAQERGATESGPSAL